MTRPRLTIVSSHTRRAPIDRYAAVRAAKTADLYEYVHGDHMSNLLCEALRIAFAEDEAFALRVQEGG